jgi:ribosome-binding factor A
VAAAVTQRTERIDEQLRQEIGAILARDIADPRIGFATITDVDTTPDLSHAKIWVSVIGQPEERRETVRALARALPYIRRQLGTRLHLRRIPELHLELDETAERGTRVLKLLEELEAGRTPEGAVEPGETLPTPVTPRTDPAYLEAPAPPSPRRTRRGADRRRPGPQGRRR